MDKFVQNSLNKPNILIMNDNKSTSLNNNVKRSLVVHTELPTLSANGKLLQNTQSNPIVNHLNKSDKHDIEAILDKITATENGFDKGDQVSDVEDIDESDMDKFKEDVKKWIDIDDKISALSHDMRIIKKQRLELNSKIVNFMRNYNIEDLNTNNGKLEYRVKHSKKGLTAKKIHENLILYFKTDKDQAETIYKYLQDNRIDLDKEILKRIKK
jgi:hypothetical protein